MAQRIEVFTLLEDGRAKALQEHFTKTGKSVGVRVVDVYTIENDIKGAASLDKLTQSFVNPVTQKAFLNDEAKASFDWAVEIGFLPGVTDNVGHTATELAALTLNDNQPVYSSRLIDPLIRPIRAICILRGWRWPGFIWILSGGL